MINIRNIFPECDVDTLLVELVVRKERPSHFQGVNNVGIAMFKKNPSNFIIGVVDTDKFKRTDKRLTQFRTIHDFSKTEGLYIKKVQNTNMHLIMIDPAFEIWMWNLAADTGVQASAYDFDNFKSFKDAAKDYGLLKNYKLRNFIKAVVTANPPAIKTLRTWLEKAV